MKTRYIKVILPLALPKTYTFSVPALLSDQIQFGIRVEVPLRNKLYSGLIVKLEDSGYKPEFRTKNIISVIDDAPIITRAQFELWQWIAEYYMCTIGEVMNVALPSGLKLSSETTLMLAEFDSIDHIKLSDDEFMVAEALQIQNELSIDTIREILDKKTVYPVIKKLLDKEVIWIKESLKRAYKPKFESYVSLDEIYTENEENLHDAFDKLSRSERQRRALLTIMELSKKQLSISRSAVYKIASVDSGVLNALEKKGIIHSFKRELSRLEPYEGAIEELPVLSAIQQKTIDEIRQGFKESHHALLHGVTGSGKTRIYQEFIEEAVQEGGQVLYLLPEIGLTSQIVHRLNRVFGDKVLVFHSKLNIHKRVEIWNASHAGIPIIIGARSSLFLPFKNLRLIIVDEEHDASFKQYSPNPRYNARDVASFMAKKWKVNIIFGSATPSLESYYNASKGLYTYIPLNKRFGEVSLPEIEIVDIAQKSNVLPNNPTYSVRLISQIQEVLNRGEQVLLFQNRRGYSPTLLCNACGWHSGCVNCDVSMTYHKVFKEIRCHYCSARMKVPELCPQCGSPHIHDLGFGTEKIEEELSKLLPEASIARMDLDTAATKNAIDAILLDFEQQKTDILIGTQMITKGLDFDHIGMVGILDADRLIQFPDFRANERAFQLMLQVGGRAGRRKKQGRVIIQTSLITHPLILDVINHDYTHFVNRELKERKQFNYPPFSRLIDITLHHKDPKKCYQAALVLAKLLKLKLGKRVLGPAVPGIARIRGLYQQRLLIKMEKSRGTVQFIKSSIKEAKISLQKDKTYASVRVIIDVDPV